VLSTGVFVAINLLFGTLYALCPGAIANVAPGSLVDGWSPDLVPSETRLSLAMLVKL